MPEYKYSILYRKLNPRRFVAYGIGLEKSGTHSLASMFAKNYRSEHELGVGEINPLAVSYKKGETSQEEIIHVLSRRDKYAWLEMDVSHPHIHYLELLLKINPNAKFILTVREPKSWLNSVFNQHVHREKRSYFDVLNEYRYGFLCEQKYTEKDSILKEKYQLYPLKSYLAYWNYHIDRALQMIPEKNLMVIMTENLNDSIPRLAKFLRVPVGRIDHLQSHSYRARRKDSIIAEVDQDFLDAMVTRYCGAIYSKVQSMTP